MSLLSLCNTTCDVQRETVTATASGGHNRSLATVYSGIPCTIQPAAGKIVNEYAKRSMVISHTVYTPTVISIQNGDIVTSDGITYVVKAWGDQAGRGRVFAIYVERKS